MTNSLDAGEVPEGELLTQQPPSGQVGSDDAEAQPYPLPPGADVITDPNLQQVVITLPIAALRPGAYQSRNWVADIRATENQQAIALERLFVGLDYAHAKLKSGRPISSRPDVIRWLGEQIADAIAGLG